jgi:hypothetical protein
LMDGVVMKANQGLIVIAQVATTQEVGMMTWKYTWCRGWLQNNLWCIAHIGCLNRSNSAQWIERFTWKEAKWGSSSRPVECYVQTRVHI